MGTRSTTKIFDGDKLLVTLYCQFDGYLAGVGKDLAEFAMSKPMVNGIGSDENVFNGPGCFAAQLIANLKTKAGIWYVHWPDAESQEFNYEIHCGYDEDWNPKPIVMKCKSPYGIDFTGLPQEFIAFIESQKDK